MSRVSRATLWGLATALSVVASAVPASASAKQFHVTGQQSTVTPSAGFNAFIAKHGITVTPLGPATIAGGSWTLPISGGRVAMPSMRGFLVHRGGITFASASATKTVTLRHFIVYRLAKRAFVAATANGHPMRLARIVGAHITKSSTGATLTGDLRLTKGAAKRIDHLFGMHVVSAGADLGSATSTVTVG